MADGGCAGLEFAAEFMAKQKPPAGGFCFFLYVELATGVAVLELLLVG